MHALASMPIMQVGNWAITSGSLSQLARFCKTVFPFLSTPCNSKTFFAISIPNALIFISVSPLHVMNDYIQPLILGSFEAVLKWKGPFH